MIKRENQIKSRTYRKLKLNHKRGALELKNGIERASLLLPIRHLPRLSATRQLAYERN